MGAELSVCANSPEIKKTKIVESINPRIRITGCKYVGFNATFRWDTRMWGRKDSKECLKVIRRVDIVKGA
jgi:hypothetical protein